MILIFSKSDFESTTDLVMDWINYLGGSCKRVNGEDFYEDITYNLEEISVCNIPIKDISCCWFRRWYPSKFYSKKLIDAEITKSNLLGIYFQLGREYNLLRNHFFSLLSDKYWLSSWQEVQYSKLDILVTAKKTDLTVPETLITSNKKALIEFKRHRRIIIKPIGDVIFLEDEDEQYVYNYKMLTTEVSDKHISTFPDTLPFLGMFQVMIEKDYEVRTFFLGEDLYSMAIFSQDDKQTMVDFRNYNDEFPNRNVPYSLPEEIRNKVIRLIKTLNLTTGSIDFIKSKNGEYVFLEINTVGQFGMISDPCNYFLEKKVAEHLIQRDEKV